MLVDAARVYVTVADYRKHHPKILPPSFRNLRVEVGGVGAGTVVTFETRGLLGWRPWRMVVDESEPGRVLTERVPDTGQLTTFTVEPDGTGCTATIESRWPTRNPVEWLLMPILARWVFADELARLDRYAASLPPADRLS